MLPSISSAESHSTQASNTVTGDRSTSPASVSNIFGAGVAISHDMRSSTGSASSAFTFGTAPTSFASIASTSNSALAFNPSFNRHENVVVPSFTSFPNASMSSDSSLPIFSMAEGCGSGGGSSSSATTAVTGAGNVSSKRRIVALDNNRSDGDIDGLLMQICSRLGQISTGDSKDELVAAFISVLCCSPEEAIFFLESSQWEIATAISLCLDNQSFERRYQTDQVNRRQDLGQRGRYIRRQVMIEGLDPDWQAFVSRSSGKIYFTHVPTGVRQEQVPPGFADAGAESDVEPQSQSVPMSGFSFPSSFPTFNPAQNANPDHTANLWPVFGFPGQVQNQDQNQTWRATGAAEGTGQESGPDSVVDPQDGFMGIGTGDSDSVSQVSQANLNEYSPG